MPTLSKVGGEVMRILWLCVILMVLSGECRMSFSQDSSSQEDVQAMQAVSAQLESFLKEKEPDWPLVKKEIEVDSIRYYLRKSLRQSIDVRIRFASSEQAASEMLSQHAMVYSIGPKARPKDVGDEAILFQGHNSDSGTLLFRRGKVFFRASGSSVKIARRIALHIANHTAVKALEK